MFPLGRFCPMGTAHDAGRTILMNGVVPTKLPCSVENVVWPQAECKDSSKSDVQVEKDTLGGDFKNILKILPMTEAFPIVKAVTEKEATRERGRPSVQQEYISKDILCTDCDYESAILPGLPDDIALLCLALVPRSDFQSLSFVSKAWRNCILRNEFYMARKLAGTLEEWLYVLAEDSCSGKMQWQALDSVRGKWEYLPSMPGPLKTAFGFVVIDEKLMVIGGLVGDCYSAEASADAYSYDPILNRWILLSKMNVARYEFACSVVDGLVYAIGGHGAGGEGLSSVEVFDRQRNTWTLIESLRRPRWGCFACGLQGKLYVMGGRSSFTIGNSRYVDIYDAEKHVWNETKNGCVMVVAHAVLNQRLFCIEWKNERQLAVFDPTENSWKRVPIPLTSSMTVGFCFAILNGKLLLFSTKAEPLYETLVYDPNSLPGSEWQVTSIRPSGMCLCSVTITA